ncbi:MAG: hypothetical protein ABIL09_07780 [Gemmatimonadota bacterium]
MRLLPAALAAALLAALAGGVAAQGAATGLAGASRQVLDQGYVYNIVDWDGGDLPKVYERSAQLPLTLEDVRKLSAGKFGEAAIVKMLEERRCACDASVDALVDLKAAGVSEAVIQAVSLHSLPPNRSLDLTVSLDFEGPGGGSAVSAQARKGYLYLIIPDGDRDRVFYGNLQAILASRWQRDEVVDNTDLVLPRQVRRVAFAATVPLKTYGPRRALVFTSTRPDIYTTADIPPADREGAMEFAFDYPVSSPQRRCGLQALYRQDALLPDKWQLERSHFECEWE